MNTISSSPKRGGGGGILHVHIYFPIGSLVQKGGHVPEMPTPPPDPPTSK